MKSPTPAWSTAAMRLCSLAGGGVLLRALVAEKRPPAAVVTAAMAVSTPEKLVQPAPGPHRGRSDFAAAAAGGRGRYPASCERTPWSDTSKVQLAPSQYRTS